jgi:hypothetical protein
VKEITGNLWDHGNDSILVVTTNGFVKNNGEAVMGRGCAKEAAVRWPNLPRDLGKALQDYGNQVMRFFLDPGWVIFTMPVKHHWHDKADLGLIERSTHQLVQELDALNSSMVLSCILPRPGCGNGQRDWETEVKPLLLPILDDRFSVITFDTDKWFWGEQKNTWGY